MDRNNIMHCDIKYCSMYKLMKRILNLNLIQLRENIYFAFKKLDISYITLVGFFLQEIVSQISFTSTFEM